MTDTHPSDLLPWYINGTLDKIEQQQIEAHLTHCIQCRDKVAYLTQLRLQIKKIEKQHQSPGELGLARLKQRMRTEYMPTKPQRWFVPVLAAAAIVIMAQAGLLLHTSSEQPMQLLSGPSKGEIQVRFVPNAPANAMAALLQSIRVKIVDGPSALGIYHLRIDAPASHKQAIATAVKKLRERDDIIQFVSEETSAKENQ